MNSNLTLWERFKADTPIEFKIVQLFGLLLMLAAVMIPVLPANVKFAFLCVGITLAILCFFIVKDVQTLSGGLTEENILKLVTDLPGQFAELKAAIADPTESIQTILDQITQLAAAPAPIAISGTILQTAEETNKALPPIVESVADAAADTGADPSSSGGNAAVNKIIAISKAAQEAVDANK